MSGGSRSKDGGSSKSRYPSGGGRGQNTEHRHKSLGKATNLRYMPGPVHLQSIKNSSDPTEANMSLVSQGGSGWSNTNKETKEDGKVAKSEKKEDGWKKTNTVPKIPENLSADFPSLGEQEKQQRSSRKDKEEPSKRKPSSIDHHSSATSNVTNRGSYSHHNKHSGPTHQSHSQRGSRYPPRHTLYPPPPRVNHPSPDPYDMPPYNPYQGMKPHREESEHVRRNTAISNKEEDEDEGWAGHQEDIDYSKEVIFEDSSDEENIERSKDKNTPTSQPSVVENVHKSEHSTSNAYQYYKTPHWYQMYQPHPHGRAPRGRSDFVPEWDEGFEGPPPHVLKKEHPRATPPSDAASPPLDHHDPEDHPGDLDSAPVPRTAPKKIMMREFVDKDGEGVSPSQQQKDKQNEGSSHTRTAWTVPLPYTSAKESEEKAKDEAVVYDIMGRGPIASDKTLYEPEGRTSEEKFRKYHRMSSGEGVVGRGRGSSSGSSCKNEKPVSTARSPTTPTPQDDGVFAEEEVPREVVGGARGARRGRRNDGGSKRSERSDSLKERESRKREYRHEEEDMANRKENQKRYDHDGRNLPQKFGKYESEDQEKLDREYRKGRGGRTGSGRGGNRRRRGSRTDYYGSNQRNEWDEYYDENYYYYYEEERDRYHQYYESRPEWKPRSESKPEQKSRSEPKPEQKSRSEPKPEQKSRSEPKPEQKSRSEPKPEQKSRSESKPEQKSRSEPKPEQKSRSESKPEQKSRSESKPEQKSWSEPKPEQKSRSEPKPEQKSWSEPKPEQKSRSEPKLEQKSRSEFKPEQKSRSESRPEQKFDYQESQHNATLERKPQSESSQQHIENNDSKVKGQSSRNERTRDQKETRSDHFPQDRQHKNERERYSQRNSFEEVLYSNEKNTKTKRPKPVKTSSLRQSEDWYYKDGDTQYEWGSKKFDGRRRGGGRGRGVVGREPLLSYEEKDNQFKETMSFFPRTSNRGRGGGRRGWGRGRGTRKGFYEEQSVYYNEDEVPSIYTGLDDIDSPSDWEEDELKQKKHEQQVKSEEKSGTSKFQSSGRVASKDFSTNSKKLDKSGLSKTLPPSSSYLSTPPMPRPHPSVGVSQSDGLLPTPKYFADIDINSHGVYVVDGGAGSDEKEVGGALMHVSSDMEGFTVVESKRDRKDRDKKRKQQEDQKRTEDDVAKQRSGPVKKPEPPHGSNSSGWSNVRSKQTTSVWSGGQRDDSVDNTSSENWGRYGAIGERPSRESNIEKNSTKVTKDNPLGNDYRLFDNNSTTTFPLNPTKSGQLLSDAINMTFSSTQVKNDNSSVETSVTSAAAAALPPSDKPRPVATPSSILEAPPAAERGKSSHQKREEDHKSVPGATATKRGRNHDQRFYMPPAARHDDTNKTSRTNYSSTQAITKPNTKKPSKVMSLLNERKQETEEGQGVEEVEKELMVDEKQLLVETLQQHQKTTTDSLAKTMASSSGKDPKNIVVDLISEDVVNTSSYQNISSTNLKPSSLATTIKHGTTSYATVLKNNNSSESRESINGSTSIISSQTIVSTSTVSNMDSPVSAVSQSKFDDKNLSCDVTYKPRPFDLPIVTPLSQTPPILSGTMKLMPSSSSTVTTPTTCNMHSICSTVASTCISSTVTDTSIDTGLPSTEPTAVNNNNRTSLSITANEFIPNQVANIGSPNQVANIGSPNQVANIGSLTNTVATSIKTSKPIMSSPNQQQSLLDQPPPHIIQMVQQLVILSQSIQQQKRPKSGGGVGGATRFSAPPTLPLASMPPPNSMLPLMVPYAPPMTHPPPNYATKQRAESYHRTLPYMETTDANMHLSIMPSQTNRLTSNLHQVRLPVTTVPTSIYPSSHVIGPPSHLFVQPSNQPLPLATVPVQQIGTPHRPPIFSQATPTRLLHPHSMAVDHTLRPALLPTPTNFNLVPPPMMGATPTRPVTTPTTVFPPPPHWNSANFSPVGIPGSGNESHMLPADPTV